MVLILFAMKINTSVATIEAFRKVSGGSEYTITFMQQSKCDFPGGARYALLKRAAMEEGLYGNSEIPAITKMIRDESKFLGRRIKENLQEALECVKNSELEGIGDFFVCPFLVKNETHAIGLAVTADTIDIFDTGYGDAKLGKIIEILKYINNINVKGVRGVNGFQRYHFLKRIDHINSVQIQPHVGCAFNISEFLLKTSQYENHSFLIMNAINGELQLSIASRTLDIMDVFGYAERSIINLEADELPPHNYLEIYAGDRNFGIKIETMLSSKITKNDNNQYFSANKLTKILERSPKNNDKSMIYPVFSSYNGEIMKYANGINTNIYENIKTQLENNEFILKDLINLYENNLSTNSEIFNYISNFIKHNKNKEGKIIYNCSNEKIHIKLASLYIKSLVYPNTVEDYKQPVINILKKSIDSSKLDVSANVIYPSLSEKIFEAKYSNKSKTLEIEERMVSSYFSIKNRKYIIEQTGFKSTPNGKTTSFNDFESSINSLKENKNNTINSIDSNLKNAKKIILIDKNWKNKIIIYFESISTGSRFEWQEILPRSSTIFTEKDDISTDKIINKAFSGAKKCISDNYTKERNKLKIILIRNLFSSALVDDYEFMFYKAIEDKAIGEIQTYDSNKPTDKIFNDKKKSLKKIEEYEKIVFEKKVKFLSGKINPENLKDFKIQLFIERQNFETSLLEIQKDDLISTLETVDDGIRYLIINDESEAWLKLKKDIDSVLFKKRRWYFEIDNQLKIEENVVKQKTIKESNSILNCAILRIERDMEALKQEHSMDFRLLGMIYEVEKSENYVKNVRKILEGAKSLKFRNESLIRELFNSRFNENYYNNININNNHKFELDFISEVHNFERNVLLQRTNFIIANPEIKVENHAGFENFKKNLVKNRTNFKNSIKNNNDYINIIRQHYLSLLNILENQEVIDYKLSDGFIEESTKETTGSCLPILNRTNSRKRKKTDGCSREEEEYDQSSD